MEIIQDGSGHGYRTRVSKEGHLATYSTTESRMAYVSRSGHTSYEFHPPTFDLYTAANYMNLVWMKNTSSDLSFFVNIIRIAYNGGNTTKLSDGHYRVFIGSDEPTAYQTTGQFGISPGPHNLNLSSTLAAPIDFRFWDRTGTTGMTIADTGNQLTCGLIGRETLFLPYEGALVIPPGFILSVAVESADEDGKGSVVINGFISTEVE